MNNCRNIFYMPEPERKGMPHGETCGDLMAFYWKGRYYLFYLYKYCIYVTLTDDFVHYSDPSIVLQSGSPEEQDWHIGTGSVSQKDGVFYFYYTGFNEGNRGKAGKNEQVLMRATSDDLVHWNKDSEFRLFPYGNEYGGLHWRDPHVFWNDELGKYCMAITATEKNGYVHRSGCSVIMTSDNIADWEHYKKIYAPRMFETHECHDIFKMGDWWYMIFSNYTRWWETRYRMARSMEGPWITPEKDDMFDSRGLYAAKTVSDDNRRFLVGWQATRVNCEDHAKYQWGGSVLVYELIQRKDGTLAVKMVSEIEDSFKKTAALIPKMRQGTWKIGKEICGIIPEGFGWLELGAMPETCLVKTTVKWDENTSACGVMLHTCGENLEKWCQLRLEIKHNKLVFDRSNRFELDQSFLEERPIELNSINQAEIKIVTSGNIIVAYVNDVALAVRAYDFEPGDVGIFVENGTAKFEDSVIMVQ